jgi:hypothetical protein
MTARRDKDGRLSSSVSRRALFNGSVSAIYLASPIPSTRHLRRSTAAENAVEDTRRDFLERKWTIQLLLAQDCATR